MTSTAALQKPEPRILNPDDLPDVYGMFVCGDCMWPDIKDGDVVGFDKLAPVEPGDIAAFFLKPEFILPDGLQVGLKRLVMAPPPWVTFPYEEHPDSEVTSIVIAEQLYPRKQYQIPCSHLLAIHASIGPIPEQLQ